MKTTGMRCVEALEFIHARRAAVSATGGFKRELLEYEQEYLSTSSGKSESTARGALSGYWGRLERSWSLIESSVLGTKTECPLGPT